MRPLLYEASSSLPGSRNHANNKCYNWTVKFLGGLHAGTSYSQTAAAATELKIFASRAITTVLEKIGPEFERTTDNKLNVTTGLHFYTTFGGAVSATCRAPEAARALLAFLKSPTAIPVIKEQGMEPI